MIILDGSHGEGGGQIFRTALALSMLTKKPFRIEKIRANRPTPGLKAQHLTGIKALVELSGSEAINAKIGSELIEFYPKDINNFRTKIDVGTAGPITLVLQSILLPLMFARKQSRIEIIGGTDVKWSPSIDYLDKVIVPQFNRYSSIKIILDKRGYYPKGGGQITLIVKPHKEKKKENIDLTRQGRLIKIEGVSHSSRDLINADVSDRQTHAARIILSGLNKPLTVNTNYVETDCPGSGITLWATYSTKDEIDEKNPIVIGSDALGEKKKRAELVGEEAAKTLVEEIRSGCALDNHAADNLIPLLGLYGGSVKTSKITDHIISNIYVTEQFLDVKFDIDEENNIISVSKSDFTKIKP